MITSTEFKKNDNIIKKVSTLCLLTSLIVCTLKTIPIFKDVPVSKIVSVGMKKFEKDK